MNQPNVNAPSFLTIPTPDQSGQSVHPDVLYVPEGFLGYRYWMGCTPYPYCADRQENPIVRVSHDGVVWQAFPGAPDPLVEAPEDDAWHHADTDIILHEGVLHVFYISTNRVVGGTLFSYISTRDGVIWEAPKVIYQAPWGVSPAVTVDDTGIWSMWYVYRDALAREQTSKIRRCQGDRADGFGAPLDCILEVPGHVVWHLDVVRATPGFEALVTAFPSGTDPSRSRLFHVVSADGIRFTLNDPKPLIRPSWFGWDNRMVYRSTMIMLDGDRRRIWYSAASWAGYTGIGLLEGPLSDLRPVSTPDSRRSVSVRLIEDAVGLAKYLVYRILPPAVFSSLLRLRARIRRLVTP